jgi:hypothetical protein
MPKLPKQQKQKSIYPYGPSIGTGEVANSKRKGKDANCPNCGAYGQFANTKGAARQKIGKNVSREVNKGTKK